jgi:hypothetical protein
LDRLTGALAGALALGLVLITWNTVVNPDLVDDYSAGVVQAGQSLHLRGIPRSQPNDGYWLRDHHCRRLVDKEYRYRDDRAGMQPRSWPEPAVAFWQGCMGWGAPGVRDTDTGD